MSWDPEVRRQETIKTACHNAIQAIANKAEAAHREGRSFDDRLALAAALEAIERERTARRPGLSLAFNTQDCIAYLRASAAPRRGQP